MCVLAVNAGEGRKQKGYCSGGPVITEVGLVVKLNLNPHTQDRRMRHPWSSQNLSSAPPARDTFSALLVFVHVAQPLGYRPRLRRLKIFWTRFVYSLTSPVKGKHTRSLFQILRVR